MDKFLELHNVSARYGAVHALQDVSLFVSQGEVVAVLGANGAGKTSLLKSLSGLIKLHSGSITYEGNPLTHVSPADRVKKGLLQVPEGRAIFTKMTVLENLDLGAFTVTDLPTIKRNIEQVYSLFPILFERRFQLGGTLSGGEQQMLAIGRALMASPRMLLLDEPSMGVAPLLCEKIFKTLSILSKNGLPILLVEQDAHAALSLAQRAYVLDLGTILLDGPADEVRKNPRVKEAYLGGA